MQGYHLQCLAGMEIGYSMTMLDTFLWDFHSRCLQLYSSTSSRVQASHWRHWIICSHGQGAPG